MNLQPLTGIMDLAWLKELCDYFDLPKKGSKAELEQQILETLDGDLEALLTFHNKGGLQALLDRAWELPDGRCFKLFGFSKARVPDLKITAWALMEGRWPAKDNDRPGGGPIFAIFQVVRPRVTTLLEAPRGGRGRAPGSEETTTPGAGRGPATPESARDSARAPARRASLKDGERSVPATRFADVLGQDAAVQALRDLIELPLRHGHLFVRLGSQPRAGGLILAGPPGTGKTLLARAAAGETGCHVELVSGPQLLSQWVGETEAALRKLFDKARRLAPSIILFDELDCLAPSRGAVDHHHEVSMVSQLLVLLDGLGDRGQVFVVGTTNRPEDIDEALRRPGRFDRVVPLALPDQSGRARTFQHYLSPLALAPGLTPLALANDLAALSNGASGADIAYMVQQAAQLCIKDAVARHLSSPQLTAAHLKQAVFAHMGTKAQAQRPRQRLGGGGGTPS